jgi:hypothetical protein
MSEILEEIIRIIESNSCAVHRVALSSDSPGLHVRSPAVQNTIVATTVRPKMAREEFCA